MTKLHDLYREQGQSPWLDNLRRDWIVGGELQGWIDRGVRGVTSNPTIFQKAMAAGDAYDEQFADLASRGTSLDDSYWTMVQSDITDALGMLLPAHDESDGDDGFVSLELAPGLAHDTAGSITAARDLHERIAAPNLFIKIPGTAEGVPAVQQMISEGRSINITLLFSLERYGEVIEAYLSGLEACEGDLSRVRSVASFFLSRVDTEVDRRLDAINSDQARALQGRAAVAQAQAAYRLFRDRFAGPRWDALAARGARVQRPLWASTSTKNDTYADTLYVDPLIGPDTVNTMPEATLEDFDDHGTVARTVDADPAGSRRVLDDLAAVGVDLADVSQLLETEGVASFAKSFDELMDSLAQKATALRGG
ncbi:transaldolase [soil metagenome]